MRFVYGTANIVRVGRMEGVYVDVDGEGCRGKESHINTQTRAHIHRY